MKSLSTLEEARKVLAPIHQEHLLEHWDHLTEANRAHLLQQIASLDLALLTRQQDDLRSSQLISHPFSPFDSYTESGNPEDRKRGSDLLHQGKCGCLILAGGQGSRLRFAGPKGTFPISPVKQKSLFQMACERILAANQLFGCDLPLAIMTAPETHVEIETFFIQHAFFGLRPKHVTFFSQNTWPLLSEEGNVFLETPSKIACGPNGNGSVFCHFVEKGVWEKWDALGVEAVNLIPIDNPLALPFDAELLGYHVRMQSEVTIKAAMRRDPTEKVGIVALVEGKPHIIEYSELGDHSEPAVANLGLYCFSMSFMQKASTYRQPLHRAKKAVRYLGKDGQTLLAELPNAWKYEEFIFDVFPSAERCFALLYSRESCFAPLKNFNGEDSIETVQNALMAYERRLFAEISGRPVPPDRKIEISADFYYPTESLYAMWQGRPLPEASYIEGLEKQ